MANNTSEITLPFDGQEFIDASRTLWRYDSSIQAWRHVGPVENVPLASDIATGLLSAVFKQMLDNIPEKGGGFGIVVKPFLSLKSPTNPDGVITGKVNVISDSMDISCLGVDGKPLIGECGRFLPDVAPGSGEEVKRPSITFKLSEEFLKTLCIELVSAPGPTGKKGGQGDPGKPGTGDGPQGDDGDSGKNAAGQLKFAGIDIRDTDDVFDTAVTAVEVDQEGGKLAVTKSKVRAPADDTPATQAISTQIDRSIEFSSGFDYTILMAPNDPINRPDVTMVGLPQGFEPNGTNKTTLNAVRLSAFLGLVIDDYKNRLAKIDEAYTKEIHDFIVDKDAKARDAINSLACQLSEAEWNLPIDYCCLPGTMITVDNFIVKPIEDIKAGELVLCSDGKIHRVKRSMVRQVDEPIVDILISGGGRILSLTGEHPVLTAPFEAVRRKGHGRRRTYRHDISKQDFYWSAALSLRENDLLFSPYPVIRSTSLPLDLCEFLGYYAAEGDARNYCVRFGLGLHEGRLASKIATIGLRLGATSTSVNRTRSSIQVCVYGKRMCEICVQHIGKGAKSKVLSKEIMGLRGLEFAYFVRALFEGDGSVTFSSTAPRSQLATASVSMAEQVYWLLLANGIVSTKWYGTFPGGPSNRSKRSFQSRISLSRNETAKLWPQVGGTELSIPSGTFAIDGGVAYRVVKVTKRRYKGSVYNLEVEKDNTYIANSVVVHNCLGLSPGDCKGSNDPKEATFRLAGSIFGPSFCETSKAEDLGTYYVPAGAGQSRPLVEVKYPNSGGMSSTQLPVGGYIVVYEGGTLKDASRPDLGNFVGRPDIGFGLTVSFIGVGGSIKIIPDITSCDRNDPVSVEAAYRNADISKKSVWAILTAVPKINLAAKMPAPYDNPSGVIAVHIYRVLPCDAGDVYFGSATYGVDPEHSSTMIAQVLRKAGSIGMMTVDFATKDGAAIAGTDYTAQNGTLSFGEGELVKIITIQIAHSEDGEGGIKSFTISLSNPQGGGLGDLTTTTMEILYSEYA
jgi:hypothetical protein